MEFTVAVVAATPAARAGLTALLHEEAVLVAVAMPPATLLDRIPIGVDVVVVDRMGAVDTVEGLLEAVDGLPLVLVGATSNDVHTAAGGAGAMAFLDAAASGPAIAAAVACAYHGLRVIDPALAAGAKSPPSDLSTRELQVLQRLAQGVTNKRLALDLAISENTVKFHVSAVLTKLGAESRTEAVAIAVRRGLVAL